MIRHIMGFLDQERFTKKNGIPVFQDKVTALATLSYDIEVKQSVLHVNRSSFHCLIYCIFTNALLKIYFFSTFF